MPVYDDPANRLEILRMGYQNQLEYLRMMSDLDLKLFTGYITLQIVLGGWLAKSPVEGLSIKVGLMVIDLAMAFIGIVAFRVNQERRAEAARVLGNLADALGFTVPGVFLPDRPIQESVPIRPWTRMYYFTVAVGVVGIALITFS